MIRALVMLAVLLPLPAAAETVGIPIATAEGPGGEQTYTLSIQIVALMTALTLLPGLLLTMSAFTRIIIVLSILRQALGTAQTPPNQVLIGIALFLTFFVMSPVIDRIDEVALQPYLAEEMDMVGALKAGLGPLRDFMLAHTRESQMMFLAELAGHDAYADLESVPLPVLMAGFVLSELTTAFQIGFLIFIPFVVVDLVVASVLMSMGMMMLSPMLISLPFKLMLFVLVDGWALVAGALAGTFVF